MEKQEYFHSVEQEETTIQPPSQELTASDDRTVTLTPQEKREAAGIQEEDYDLVVVILPRHRRRFLKEIEDQLQGIGYFHLQGSGTASSSLLEALGLEEQAMYISFNCVRHEDCEEHMARLRHGLALANPGHGIAFALPMERSLGLLPLFAAEGALQQEGFLASLRKRKKQKQKPEVPPLPTTLQPYSKELLVAILNRDYAMSAMHELHQLGARGGTILPAAGRSAHAESHFLGMDLVPEKEILLLVLDQEDTIPFLRHLYIQGALSQPGSGIAFSLPIYLAVGLAPRRSPANFQEEEGEKLPESGALS